MDRQAIQLEILDRVVKELVWEQSVDVNKDDTGVYYYYTAQAVQDAIERVRNQILAENSNE